MTQIVQWGERDPNLSLIGVIQLDTNTRQIVNVYQHLTTVGVCTISHVGTEKQEFKWAATCSITASLSRKHIHVTCGGRSRTMSG